MISSPLISRYLIFIIIILSTIASLGTSTWRKGKITLKDGTILTGEVKDEEWINNPKMVEFKDAEGKTHTFSAKDILNFSTDRPARYEASAIEYDGDDQRVNFLPSTPLPLSLKKDTLFLEVLVNAKIALLLFTEQLGRKHFFIRKKDRVEELLFREFLVDGDVNQLGKNEKYKKQLIGEAVSCPEIHAIIMNLQYSEALLKKAFLKINKCQNNQIESIWDGVINKKKNDAGIVIQPFVARTELSFMYAKTDHVNWAGGFFYEAFSRSKPNRFSLYSEILYKNIKQDAKFSYTNYLGKTSTGPTEFEMRRISITHSMRFSVPNQDNNGRFFGGIGLNWGFRSHTLVNGKDNVIDAIGTNPAIYAPQNVNEFKSTTFEIGLNAGIGKTFFLLKKCKVNLEIRYQLDPYANGTSFYGAHNIGFGLGVKIL